MPDEIQIGGMTVVEDGDLVSATRDSAIPQPVAEPTEDTRIAAPVVDDKKEAATEGETDADRTERDEQGRFKPRDDKKPPVERRKDSIQAQIDRARYELGEEQRRLERVRQEREALERAPKPADQPKPTPATGQTFKDFVVDYAAKNPNATYEDAIDAFQEIRDSALLAKLESKSQQDAASREISDLMKSHQERLTALTATIPDWNEKFAAAMQFMAQRGFENLPAAMFNAIMRSPKSEQIVQDLTLHPEIAYQVALDAQDLPATPAAVKLMRTVLEARLSSSGKAAPPSGPVSPPIQSRSNPPPKPVGNSPVASASSEDEPSYDEVRQQITDRHFKRR